MRLPFAAWVAAAMLIGACSRDASFDEMPVRVVDRGEPEAGAGQYASLAVDSFGRPHMAYYHADERALRYAQWDGSSWVKSSPVAAEEKVETGRQAQLIIRGGTRHLAFQRVHYKDAAMEARSGSQVWYGTSSDGEKWTLEAVDEKEILLGDFIALGVSAKKPTVAYYDATNGDLMVAKRENGAWGIAAIDKAGDVGRYVSLDVDAAGRSHLAYYDAGKGALKYAVETQEGFAIETVDAGGDVGMWTRIQAQPLSAADPNEVAPKIAYYDNAAHVLRLAEMLGGRWETSVVDDSPYVGTDTSFLWLADDTLAVAYFDSYNLDLKLARRSAAGWSRQTLLTQGAVGMYNSLAKLPSGKLALGTYSLSQGALYYMMLPVRP